jgi:hypothetical protein
MFNGSFVFFGFYCLLIGYLIFRPAFLPRILGVLMAPAGLGWLTFLSPPLGAKYLYRYILAMASEQGLLTLWLLVKGVNVQRWKEQAGAAGRLASLEPFLLEKRFQKVWESGWRHLRREATSRTGRCALRDA